MQEHANTRERLQQGLIGDAGGISSTVSGGLRLCVETVLLVLKKE